MATIGVRLREERERLALTQRAFGEIGGVEPNAQGKYESGERHPKADYLAAVAAAGVDVLYVLTGRHTPVQADGLADTEQKWLAALGQLPSPEQALVIQLAHALARKPA
ncbi:MULTISPECIES: helix-turn-helix domain-containing protein [unclassified Pseudomonas]|uniref:helix-turn-helix domain-containing protein n=1 Tax=unclassified Pseudomonas TaxID=196821 RepID=UPI000BDB306B|nr:MULTISPECIES: helix-turn-helix transcriptional regulator [unclassified Pseudomonas]PVZ19584.1 helix-turn-helix protein [Pseudomonas sp. URIL14HWK12:I12]PVZ22831.1 helix-turn-helix protein [Pseudomonas sp. URIL14HWK12:I10]PVZ37539.1 helix-turn-helix protein [Pseudomonas sp. URIL14HWK12:I11]SNZ15046.1 Predicted transcriptional regulators [Pseudomonas sp. URIL14HWK12:I9]